MMEWLHLRLAGPLVAFGGIAIDHVGPTREFPSISALTGLLGNALGHDRTNAGALQNLQDRLIYGAITVEAGHLVTDDQNARTYEGEPGWTTSGRPETRNKGQSYGNRPLETQTGNQAGRKWLTHRRRRNYLADNDTRVVFRLAGEQTDLDEIEAALNRPSRPLFIGRKPCLPVGPLVQGRVVGKTALAALRALCIVGPALWPDEGENPPDGARHYTLPDLRNWPAGHHMGARTVIKGTLS